MSTNKKKKSASSSSRKKNLLAHSSPASTKKKSKSTKLSPAPAKHTLNVPTGPLTWREPSRCLRLLDLEDDLLLRVCQWMNVLTLFHFSCTCASLRRVALSEQLRWARSVMLKKAFEELLVLQRAEYVAKESVCASLACTELVEKVMQGGVDKIGNKSAKGIWKAKKMDAKMKKKAKENDVTLAAILTADGIAWTRLNKTRIFLTGAPNSGKTTFLKHLEDVFGDHKPQDLLNMEPSHVVQYHNLTTFKKFLSSLVIDDTEFKKKITDFLSTPSWTHSTPSDILFFWNSTYLRPIFESNSYFPLLNTEHYIKNSLQALNDTYVPSKEDFFMVKGATKPGLTEKFINYEQMQMAFFEFNEEIDEKEAWEVSIIWRDFLHLWDDVAYFIYFVSLEGYDVPILGNPQITQLERSYEMWLEVISKCGISGAEPILLFTKLDLFTHKYQTNPPTSSMPFFRDLPPVINTCETTIQFIQDKFIRNVNRRRRPTAMAVSCLESLWLKNLLSLLKPHPNWDFDFLW